MKAQSKQMTRLEYWFLVVCISVLAMIAFGFASVYAEDFAIKNNYLGDTYNEVILIYDISGVVQDTAYKYNVNRWDTTFSGISDGYHRATFLLIDSSSLSDTGAFWWTYPYAAGVSISSADISEIADSISSRGLTGNGYNAIVLYANDTSKSIDVVVPYSRFTIYDSAGTTPLYTDVKVPSSGHVTFMLDTGYYQVRTFMPGYYWPVYTLSVAGDNDSVQIAGYDTDSPEYTTIYGYIKALDGGAVYGARIEVKRSGSCNYATIDSATTTLTTAIWNEPKVVYTDTSGYWHASVIRSSEYDDANCGYYYVEAKWDSRDVYKTGKLWVTGATLDVSDSLVSMQGAN